MCTDSLDPSDGLPPDPACAAQAHFPAPPRLSQASGLFSSRSRLSSDSTRRARPPDIRTLPWSQPRLYPQPRAGPARWLKSYAAPGRVPVLPTGLEALFCLSFCGSPPPDRSGASSEPPACARVPSLRPSVLAAHEVMHMCLSIAGESFLSFDKEPSPQAGVLTVAYMAKRNSHFLRPQANDTSLRLNERPGWLSPTRRRVRYGDGLASEPGCGFF